MSGNSALKRIQENYQDFGRAKRVLADYILEHYDQAAFFTAAQLGRAAGVSSSTAARFAQDLGYEGYSLFQEDLAKMVRSQLNMQESMQETYGEMEKSELLDEILRTDMQRIERTRHMISARAFEEAVDILEGARDIYVIGLRNSAPLAQYLYFYLRLIFHHVLLVSSSSEHELLEQMLHVGGEDAVVGISFPRYSLRTLRLLEFANSRQARVITLTDKIHAPINLYSSCILTAAADISSVACSMTAPMGVVDALITALSVRNSAAVMMNLQLMERTLQDYQTSGNDEMDLLEEGVQLKWNI